VKSRIPDYTLRWAYETLLSHGKQLRRGAKHILPQVTGRWQAGRRLNCARDIVCLFAVIPRAPRSELQTRDQPPARARRRWPRSPICRS